MFLGIDQGTTGSTAVVLNSRGEILGKATAAVPQNFPQPGWVEHDAEDIWKSVGNAVTSALEKANVSAQKLAAIGITNQRETVSVFENDRALHRFIVWQDRRTASECEILKKKFSKIVFHRTGLPLDPYFSATKIAWLLKSLKISKSEAKRRAVKFRTIDSFLMNRLTGADVIEATNASRTSLLNLRKAQWDAELFELFGIPETTAPRVISSEKINLKTKGVGFLPDGIPIDAALGDQQAALFGQMGWNKGSGKITYGTGSFILLNTGEKVVTSKNSLVSTIALQWASGKRLYALEGSAFICGAWVQWLRDQLGILDRSSDSEKLASQVESSEEVLIIPALSGMGAPFWKPYLRGAILGLTRGSNRNHIARASLESLCFQNKALIDAMKRDLPQLKMDWRVDGGAVANNLLLQIQADVLGTKIIRPKNLEATGTGVALLAAHSRGELSLNDIQNLWKQDRVFSPQTQNIHAYRVTYDRWQETIDKLV